MKKTELLRLHEKILEFMPDICEKYSINEKQLDQCIVKVRKKIRINLATKEREEEFIRIFESELKELKEDGFNTKIEFDSREKKGSIFSGIKSEDMPVKKSSKSFEVKNLSLTIDNHDKSVKIQFPTTIGIGIIKTKKINSKYEYTFDITGNGTEITFTNNKGIWEVGRSGHCTLFKRFKSLFETKKIYPKFNSEEVDIDKSMQLFVDKINFVEDELRSTFEKWEDEEKKKISWAEAFNKIEKFDVETMKKADEILDEGTLIERVLDSIELNVVAQRKKVGLSFLIALSTFFPQSIHGICIAPTSKGKSTISDAVYDIFPEQLKQSIGKDSTIASLYNMTKYKEGPHILEKKLIRLGDLGNAEEQEDFQLGPTFKELMSEGKIYKTISVKENDEQITCQLVIEGLGSVQTTLVEDALGSQLTSRNIIYSPDVGKNVDINVKDYQLDGLEKIKRKKKSKIQRPPLAAGILRIHEIVEGYENKFSDLSFLNPYARHMNELLNIDISKNVFRDRNQFTMLPNTVTLANIKKRDVWVHEEDNDAIVVCTPEDYLYSLDIIGKPISQMVSDVPSIVEPYIVYIQEKVIEGRTDLRRYEQYEGKEPEWWNIEVDEKPCVTINELMDHFGLSSNTQPRKVLGILEQQNLVFKVRIGNPNFYFPTQEFLRYSPIGSNSFLSKDELNINSEMGLEVQKIYNEQIKALKKY